MDAKSKNELDSIKRELQSIINELYNIANGVSSNFKGIGNDKCSKSITNAAKHYEDVKRQLNKID